MKKILFGLSSLLIVFNAIASDSIDRIGVNNPLIFNKTNFNIYWTAKPNDTYYIQEYLPEGYNSSNYVQMLTIHLFKTDLSTKDAVGQKLEELKTRKKTDEVCNYKVIESPNGKEFIVDFLMSESINDKISVIEFNIYRYKQIKISNKKALLVYCYTKRSFGAETADFLKSLKTDRTKYINEIISSQLPTINLVEN